MLAYSIFSLFYFFYLYWIIRQTLYYSTVWQRKYVTQYGGSDDDYVQSWPKNNNIYPTKLRYIHN